MNDCGYTDYCYPEVSTDVVTYRIGESAKNALHTNPKNTVFDAKRMIGRKMDDQDLKRDMKHWPFRVHGKNGKPSINVKYRGEDRDFVGFFAGQMRLFGIDLCCSFPRKLARWS